MPIRLRLVPRQVGGITCPTPVVTLRVRDTFGTWAELPFRVDTQADLSAIPMAVAIRERIPFSQDHRATLTGLVGQTQAYRDTFRVQISGREYQWPCHFVVPASVSSSAPVTAVLGRAGFLDDFAVTIDTGILTLSRRGPTRRLFRAYLLRLLDSLGLVGEPEQPV